MQRALGLAFERHEVHKRYEAVVAGRRPQAVPARWLAHHRPAHRSRLAQRPLRIIDTETGKPSITRWRELAHAAAATPGTTRLSLEPSPAAPTSCGCT